MDWAVPRNTPNRVDAAGQLLASETGSLEEIEDAFEVLSNWRASHAFPLNTIQMNLRQRSRKVSSKAIVAQRLKRTPSILFKLRRLPTMRLSQMQDIGGCRAVLPTADQVLQLNDSFRRSKALHHLERTKDYIATPARTGYRGIHLIYRFRSSSRPEFENSQIEVQLRSAPQHAWATAVETMGTFLRQSLKSNLGEERWLKFFALAGAGFASLESAPRVPGVNLEKKALREEVGREAKVLEVRKKLRAYGRALRIAEGTSQRDAHFFLLSLDPEKNALTVRGYRREQMDVAAEDYLAMEREQAEKPGAESVLVSAESLASLRRAYPNYYLDTDVFFETLDRFLKS